MSELATDIVSASMTRSAACNFGSDLDDVVGYLRIAGLGMPHTARLLDLRNMMWSAAQSTGASPSTPDTP